MICLSLFIENRAEEIWMEYGTADVYFPFMKFMHLWALHDARVFNFSIHSQDVTQLLRLLVSERLVAGNFGSNLLTSLQGCLLSCLSVTPLMM